MKKLRIIPGCISCGACEFIAPDIFEVTDVSRVKPDADIAAHQEVIKKAVKACPVQAIIYDEESDDLDNL